MIVVYPLFGRCSQSAVNQMQLIAVVVAVNIVTDDITIARAEHLSGLLAD